MDRVCPRCRGTTPHSLCPRCGVATYETEAVTTDGAADTGTVAGGLVIGVLLAQGLYYGLYHLGTAWLLGHGGPAAEETFRDSLGGLVLRQALQAAALIVGGMLAAAGRRRGMLIGATVGVANALLLIGLQHAFRRGVDDFFWLSQPPLHAFVGAAGGVIGSWVWQPPPRLAPLTGDGRAGQEALSTVIPERPEEVDFEPWPWGHILLGVLVAVGGTIGARFIRDLVVVAGGGTGREMQSQLITWEIALMAQVIGGVIAGAATRNGVLYGFWVGVPAAVILAIGQSVPALRVPSQALPSWLAAAPGGEGEPIVLVLQGIQAVLLGTLGGWLGALILPADPGRRWDIDR